MKIGVPTMGDSGLEEEVSRHFGRAPTFTLIDTENDEIEVIPNTSEHAGGTGKPPQKMEEKNVDVMLCSNLGPRAIRMFEDAGIEVYLNAGDTVEKALERWHSGELDQATEDGACEEHRH